MSDLIEVVIDSVRVSLMSPQRIVVLREKDVDRYLPIWVGPYEAEAITVALQEVEMVRPLTHDLLNNVFTSFNAQIERIEISALRDDIFYGNIIAKVDGKVIQIDSRPSDAIALAIRAHVPILVDRSVMDAAAITPEPDIQEQGDTPADEDAASQPPAEGDERLSIFEDFLNKLDDEDHPDKAN
jgi:bifunctional DNase/RNase